MTSFWAKLYARKMIECPVCEGWGQRFTSPHMTDPSAKDRWHDCGNCGGRGEIEVPEEETEEDASACHTAP